MLPYPQIDPVALAIGPLKIHWYGLMYLIEFAGVLVMGRMRLGRDDATLHPSRPVALGRREDLLKGDLARQPKLLRIDRAVLRNPHRCADGVVHRGEGLGSGILDDCAVAAVLIQLRLHRLVPRGVELRQ